jgi:sugar/nucleoside kinase (ribokinase family)
MSENNNQSKLLSAGAKGLQIAVGVAAVGAVTAGVVAVGSLVVGALVMRRFVKHQSRIDNLAVADPVIEGRIIEGSTLKQ